MFYFSNVTMVTGTKFITHSIDLCFSNEQALRPAPLYKSCRRLIGLQYFPDFINTLLIKIAAFNPLVRKILPSAYQSLEGAKFYFVRKSASTVNQLKPLCFNFVSSHCMTIIRPIVDHRFNSFKQTTVIDLQELFLNSHIRFTKT